MFVPLQLIHKPSQQIINENIFSPMLVAPQGPRIGP